MLNKCNILNINSKTSRINVGFSSRCSTADTSTAKLHIYRYGYDLPLLEYDVFQVTPDKLSFYVDSLLHDLPDGRYYGKVLLDDAECGRVELNLDNSCNIGVATCETATSTVCLTADPSSCEGTLCS
jgi:hypothetical protein